MTRSVKNAIKLPDHETVAVSLGDRSYDILIGSELLTHAGSFVLRSLPNARATIITDEHVAEHYLEPLMESLRAVGIATEPLVLKPGEKTKNYANMQAVCDHILACKLERSDAVIALGGGVIGDLTGFAAGIVRRGMKFIQVPTSLLAQVDSSVGGKTGINTGAGKNLVGVFHQPQLVLIDTSSLDTLSVREMRAGYAEVAKYGLIDRPDFFDWLEKNWRGIFDGGPERAQAIALSCQAKADVVAADELEHGRRALLNLGHTFGHALEAATDYNSERLVHGEGVAIGMVLAHKFSARLNLASPDDASRVSKHLREVGLPTLINDIDGSLPPTDILMEHIAQDKKVSRGELNFILTKGIGQSFVANNVPAEEVRRFLEDVRKDQ